VRPALHELHLFDDHVNGGKALLDLSRITFLSFQFAQCPLLTFGCCDLLLALPEAVVLSPYRPYRAGKVPLFWYGLGLDSDGDLIRVRLQEGYKRVETDHV
jgi:hypothetical protein